MRFAVIHTLCLSLLIGLLLVHRGLAYPIPGFYVLSPSLLLVAALCYLPMLNKAIDKGAISVPPQTVSHYERPRLFWFVAVTHGIFCLIAICAALLALVSALVS